MFVFLFSLLFIKLILCGNVCFDNDIAETHLHLGTKTAYRILENSETNVPKYSGKWSLFNRTYKNMSPYIITKLVIQPVYGLQFDTALERRTKKSSIPYKHD